MARRKNLAISSASFIFLVFILCHSITKIASQDITLSCMDDTWSLLPDGYLCYKVYSATVEYADASRHCQALGGHLADPHNRVEINFIAELAETAGVANYWIGLYSIENTVASDTGTSRSLAAYYWSRLQPGDTGYTSGKVPEYYFPYTYGYSLESERIKQGFVCERDACLDTLLTCYNGDCSVGETCDEVSDCSDMTDELACDADCYYTQEGDSGTVDSEHPYVDSKTCRWTLMSEPGTQIKLTFTAFETEQTLDEVLILIGGPTQNSATLYKRFSGDTLPEDPVYSDNNFMIVIFTPDSSVTANGFTADWIAEPLSGMTDENLVADTAPTEILSPNYPDMLLSSTRLSYVITARQRTVVTLQIVELEWAGATDAFIEVIDGPEHNGPVLARLTFGATNPTYVMSVSNAMIVYVHTSSLVTGGSYKFYFWEGCDIVLNQTSGVVVSPGYGVLDYPNFQTCTFTILSPTGDGIKAIASDSFNLADDTDLLNLYDGADENGTALLTDATGSSMSPTEFLSPEGHFHIVFTSGAVGAAEGFSIMFGTDCPTPDFSAETITDPAPFTTSLGDSITLSCPTGYEFGQESHYESDEVTITCESTGWDVVQIPNCQPICCGQPPQVENGYVKSSTGVSFMDTATYDCFLGNGLTGSATITCMESGDWDAAPTCTEQLCDAIDSLENGAVTNETGDGTAQGTILHFECDDGYDVIGDARLLCSAGEWSAESPTCQLKQCPLPEIPDASFDVSEVFYQETVTVTCDDGFEINGTSTLTCNAQQGFDEAIPGCVDKDECQTDPSVCTAASCENTVGSYYCYCADGYETDPANPDACVDIDECDLDYCNQDCANDMGSYSCECWDGYTLYDEAGAQGIPLAEGETGLLPRDLYSINHTCVPIQCPDLEPLENGVILSTQTTFHTFDVVNFTCNLGYELNGTESITCGDSAAGYGSWSADPPTCRTADCEAPDVSSSMFPPTFSADTVFFGEVMEINCSNIYWPGDLILQRECVYDQIANTYRILMDDLLECPGNRLHAHTHTS